ncbi:hypothetical protein D7030_09145 [Flavobacteriaceae bacterium AU392]|nr:hypothetical protein D1817_15150 [Flavobacteriaceae bacterium]RKM84222.1 hypothetical protein D7030_09145 [Flavobacteriaceae bacterium AU392]
MLSKTKSNQILKFKYALLIPMVFGMLLYTSCEKETVLEEEEILATISELNFSVLINSESRNNIDELMAPFKENDEKMNVFLRANPNYVKWVTISPDRISHTIHNTSEQVPDGYNKLEGFKEEDKGLIYYLGFADFKNENSKEKLETESYEEDEVPFAKIDRVPVFPGCEGLDKEAQRKCLSNKIASHVNKNFNLNLGKKLGLSGRQKIHVFFKIDENGNITEIRSRAPHLELEEEAERVIESLPKMKPGKHQGENVIVPYALPIIFQIHD